MEKRSSLGNKENATIFEESKYLAKVLPKPIDCKTILFLLCVTFSTSLPPPPRQKTDRFLPLVSIVPTNFLDLILVLYLYNVLSDVRGNQLHEYDYEAVITCSLED